MELEMQFIDLKEQYMQLQDQINLAINKVLKHQSFINGPEVYELEEKLKEYTSSLFCISVANGTDALEIAQKAINIRAGDEVIVPSYTWVSTAETVKYLGATPIYCDVDERTFNIDLDDLKQKITKHTKAIIAVSLFGQCAELLELKKICDEYNIFLIEDAAQSFGAKHHGFSSCNIAHISTTSFFPSKPLGCYGDGGAIFTNDENMANKMRLIARHGKVSNDRFDIVGRNSRLDTLQASILLVKLKVLDKEILKRNEIHSFYSNNINPSVATTPFIEEYNISAFAQYTLRVNPAIKEKIMHQLKKHSIPFMCYYEHPIYKQKAYLSNIKILPVTDLLAKSTISIPMSPYISPKETEIIVNAINETIN